VFTQVRQEGNALVSGLSDPIVWCDLCCVSSTLGGIQDVLNAAMVLYPGPFVVSKQSIPSSLMLDINEQHARRVLHVLESNREGYLSIFWEGRFEPVFFTFE
jgi:hypothetical protein